MNANGISSANASELPVGEAKVCSIGLTDGGESGYIEFATQETRKQIQIGVSVCEAERLIEGLSSPGADLEPVASPHTAIPLPDSWSVQAKHDADSIWWLIFERDMPASDEEIQIIIDAERPTQVVTRLTEDGKYRADLTREDLDAGMYGEAIRTATTLITGIEGGQFDAEMERRQRN